jgi:hypothetical protein
MQLIPLPEVEEAYLSVSYAEEQTPAEQLSAALATMQDLAATNRQALDTIQNGVVPSDLVVNVQSSEVNPLRPAKPECETSHPLAGQMRTRVRECWTNLRDLLPCY